MNPRSASEVARADAPAPGVKAATAAASGDAEPVAPPASGRLRGFLRSPRLLIAAGLVLLLLLPLLVALGVLAHPRWFPTLDMAMTEIRVRRVGTSDTPLIGLPSRIEADGVRGSHPGPLSFWVLAPGYRLFGSSAWALQASMVLLQGVLMGVALWIARRRGGLLMVVGVAAILALLVRAYGADILTEAWNPHIPLLFWIVLLLAVWSVLCDDLALLPVAVFAGSVAAQTHIPYLGLASALLAFTFAAAFVQAYTRRRHDPAALPRFRNWGLIGVSVGILAWLPPLIDEVTENPGNISVIRDYFRESVEPSVGVRDGIELVLIHLDPWRLVNNQAVLGFPQQIVDASWVPGALFLMAWAATVVIAWRLRLRAVLLLDLMLAVLVVLAVISTSRILGLVWYYLLLWMWGITALMLLATIWTAAVAIGRHLDAVTRSRAVRAAPVALTGLIVVVVAVTTVDATKTDIDVPSESTILAEMMPDVIDAIEGDSAPGGGPDGRYLFTWEDPIAIGSQPWGVFNELDRLGYEVGFDEALWGVAPQDQRLRRDEATAEIHVVLGPGIGTWGNRPGVERVAYVDPRTPEEREEYNRLRTELVEELEAVGAGELADDPNYINAATHPDVTEATKLKILRLVDLGLPTAVFIGPA